jgi:ADP-ribose pyrophosphatase YjhB (NUDIX family)
MEDERTGSKRLLSRETIPFTEKSENTFGLEIVRESWETGNEKRVYWKYALPDAVQIFALTTKKKVIAISEFQPGVGTDYVHLPGETMEEGESPLQTADRGLLEETGYHAGSMKLMSSILENSGRSDRLIHMVLAFDCYQTENGGEQGISTTLLDPQDFWEQLMEYFSKNPEGRHGGGNTLKVAVLALHELQLLKCSR